MKNAIWKSSFWLTLMGVQQREVGRLSFATLFAVSVGAIQGFLVTTALTIFLLQYNSVTLPYVYISSAVAVIALGLAYSRFEKSLPLSRLLPGTSLLAAGLLVLLWSSLVFYGERWVVLAFIISVGVLYQVASTLLSAFVSPLFNLQEGKRVLGFVSASQGVGGIIAGFSIPLWVRLFALSHLILVIAAIFISLIFIYRKSAKRFSDRLLTPFAATNEDSAHESPTGLISLLKNRFVFAIFLFSILIEYQYYFLDMLFNTQAEQNFLDEKSLSSFMGVFFASTDVLNIALGAFGFAWILRRFGLVIGLFFLPVATGIFSLIIFQMNLISGGTSLVFWLVVVTKLFNENLSSSIHWQSTGLILQPLPYPQRIAAQVQRETLIKALGTAIAASSILIVERLYGVVTSVFSLSVAVACALAVMTLLYIRKAYVRELQNALTKRRFNPQRIHIADKIEIDILSQLLASPYPQEAIYALSLFEQLGEDQYHKAVFSGLDHPSPLVRGHALKAIADLQIDIPNEKLQAIMSSDPEPKNRSRALSSLIRQGNLHLWKDLSVHMASKNSEIKKEAIAAFCNYATGVFHDQALEQVEVSAHSTTPDERILSAQIIEKLTKPLPELLFKLLSDPDSKVRTAATLACRHRPDSRYVPVLLELLEASLERAPIRVALIAHQHHFVAFAQNNFGNLTRMQKDEAIKLCGALSPNTVSEFLFNVAAQEPTRDSSLALEALNHAKVSPTVGAQQTSVVNLLERATQRCKLVYGLRESIAEESETSLLRDALKREVELTKNDILNLLALIYDRELMLKAQRGFASSDEEMQSFALELLSTKMDKTQGDIISLFANMAIELKVSKDTLQEDLAKILSEKDGFFHTPLVVSAAIYSTKLLKLKDLFGLVNACEKSKDPLISETAKWAV